MRGNTKTVWHPLCCCIVVALAAACSSQPGAGSEGSVAGKADDLACQGATLDAHGYCRLPNGRFAASECCELELLADCLAETEDCLGNVEDEGYMDSCGDEIDGTMCVSTEACPAWVFEDPERTPHEILRIDISEQCHWVCIEWLPDCMRDMAYDEDYDLAGAFAACIDRSGCRSDVCETNAELCAELQADFEETRDGIEPYEPPEPTEPEEWTLEQCAAEAEECFGHTEDETYFDACGDDWESTTVCINEESCPAWIFEDPERTPLEILDIDISEQCDYVCAQYLPECMYEMGWGEGTLEQAFSECIPSSGCPSDICEADAELCAAATTEFNDARG